ncbi:MULTISPECIES: dihydrofolate reductase family protein [Micromonospora]|uniref:Deaminase n=1 Tax=Micromonospora solifontis TaxID=2487138 RepID=A0ABX9WAH8_9ACTN|nr:MULTISPECIES: dihydrofolate reductase family protein [Micromonospora]NES16203.1 deaminase [Micromonospora sp. PPF5-17B]NES38944.1 deaminase [Micromonospora solifontis]NES57690.1 deaminase [Micromonospora sp. PPF5-6]RNL92315.1 deaminase [Micromonospora solifontis]
MSARPYVLLSCAMSIDGYIDDASTERLVLSNDHDLDRVDEVRAACDAILVGAATVRRDDPRLLVRSERRQADRLARGLPPSPVKVTVTGSGDLDPTARFFTFGDGAKLVYCPSGAVEKTREQVGDVATVVDGGEPVTPQAVVDDLAVRGVRRLMVEGGGSLHCQFLTAGLADELHLVVAPFFVGDCRAPRFVRDGRFPWHPGRRARVVEVRQIDDVVLTRYALSDRCDA